MKALNSLVTLFLACLVLPAWAAGPYEEGKHYKRLAEPVPVRQPQKIEVAEVFSYACGHCFNFESLLQDWKKDLPEDVNFEEVHVVWDKTTENLARALYTAEALRVRDKVHPALFRAIHVERKRVQTKDQILDIVEQQGVDRERFSKAFDSFGINSNVSQGEAKAKGAQISGTPSLIVDGRYVIEARGGIDHKTMLDIADHLVAQIRQERG